MPDNEFVGFFLVAIKNLLFFQNYDIIYIEKRKEKTEMIYLLIPLCIIIGLVIFGICIEERLPDDRTERWEWEWND
jgi:hypothetical protein